MSAILDWLGEWFQARASLVYKLVVRLTTGRCELERIALSSPPAASDATTFALQQRVEVTASLRRSAQLSPYFAAIFGSAAMPRSSGPPMLPCTIASAQEVNVVADKLVHSIASVKRFDPSSTATQSTVLPVLTSTVRALCAVNYLAHQLQAATEPYDEKNPRHEELLLKLWSLLRPGQKLTARHSSDWEQLGFQGENPATDFRAMGLLGLSNLVAFAEVCGLDAGRLLRESQDGGLRYYSWAITGVNLSADLVRLTRERVLDHYYLRYGASVQSFQALYCVFFVRFNEAWVKANPVNVMEFSKIHSAFLTRVRFEAAHAHKDGYEFLQPLVDVSKYNNRWM